MGSVSSLVICSGGACSVSVVDIVRTVCVFPNISSWVCWLYDQDYVEVVNVILEI